MTEFVHVGDHADILASGRGIGRGDRVTETDLDLDARDHRGEDQHLIDSGSLVDMKTFENPDGPTNAPSLPELRARAAELDVAGRSKMNADELAEAIAEAEQREGVTNAS